MGCIENKFYVFAAESRDRRLSCHVNVRYIRSILNINGEARLAVKKIVNLQQLKLLNKLLQYD